MDTIIDAAIMKFSTLGFTLDVLADNDSISSKHIQEVSGLPEGTVAALRKFAHNWCGQLEVKRARTVRATLPPSTLFADRALLCRGYSTSEPNT